MNWRLWQTAVTKFWQQSVQPHLRHPHLVLARYFRVGELVHDVSYQLLRGWRWCHHLGELAAIEVDADCFGTKLTTHESAYRSLRRAVQATELAASRAVVDVSDLSPDEAVRVMQRRTKSRPGSGAEVTTTLTAAEARQINGVFSAAWRESQKTGEPWPYATNTNPAYRHTRAPRQVPRSPRATAKPRRIVTKQPSRSAP